jgi:hypothetical protein
MAKTLKEKDEIVIENVLRLIKEKGWLESEFCRKISERFEIKFEQSNFNSLKTGIRGIGNKNLQRFSDILETTIKYLLTKHDKLSKESFEKGPEQPYDQNYQIGKDIGQILNRLTEIEKMLRYCMEKIAPPGEKKQEWDGTDRRHSERRREGGGKK